jgi:hypothetical protein
MKAFYRINGRGQCQAYSQMVDYSNLFFTDGKDGQEIIVFRLLCIYCNNNYLKEPA